MTRLETIRKYFIERFFATLLADPQFRGLRYPSELFDSSGNFKISPDISGFVRIPTPQNLEQRINSSESQQERDDLIQFRNILLRALSHITGGLVNLDLETAMNLARNFAPYIRHPDDQNFFPLAVEKLLNYQDSTLQTRFYDQKGQTPLSGRIYELMFENPDVANATSFSTDPFVAKVPFVATVGITPNQPGFPKTPLSQGRLNIAAADARLNPGNFQPTVYVEIKSVVGSMVMNALYEQAASMPGAYAALRNNRIHKDPSPIEELQVAGLETEVLRAFQSNRGNNSTVPPNEGPLLLVYHGFYPVDDAARRRPEIETTNREFHHLAVGLMIFAQGQIGVPTFVFTCEGPDVIRMFPSNHPFLKLRNDLGEVDPEGTHITMYATLSFRTLGLRNNEEISGPNKNIIEESVGKNAPVLGRLLGAATVAGLGCAAGAAVVGTAGSIAIPVIGTIAGAMAGCKAGAIAALIVYIIVSFICLIFGCGDDPDTPQNQPGITDQLPPSEPRILTETNSVGPPGAVVAGRTFTLKAIPHFSDHNLYGLHSDGEGTLHIDDDPNSNEMLGWLAFPGGIGYQFDPQVPGKQDIAGSSLRNYFDLFTKKYIEVQKAQELVTYFGDT